MHIIGIRLDGGKENVIKNLQPGWYPFGNFVEPVWKNNYEWRKPGSMAENLYQTCPQSHQGTDTGKHLIYFR